MSDRERWIVYPLLLLALGTSMRMKMFGTDQLAVHRVLDAEQISCRKLVLQNEEGKNLMLLTPSVDGKRGVILAEKGSLEIDGPVLAKAMRCEELAVVDRAGQRVMTLAALYKKKPDGTAQLQGGSLLLFNDANQPRVILGESPIGGTVTTIDDRGRRVIIGHLSEPDARLAGLFTLDQDGKTLRLAGSRIDKTIEPKKPDEAKKPNEPKMPSEPKNTDKPKEEPKQPQIKEDEKPTKPDANDLSRKNEE
jgi:hypothetical protein